MPETNEEKIREILTEGINKLINSLSRDFQRNYDKKSNNWILKDFDERIMKMNITLIVPVVLIMMSMI
jgi:hypothetical protein